MDVTFLNPPLNEVALSYTFLPRPDILIPHIGKFWTRIEDRYPRCQHASPILDEGSNSFLGTELPLPRVWMISEDDTSLVQLQQDRLIFNWRDKGGTEYVRFPSIRAEFERVRGLFEAFALDLTGAALVPASYSLTYVNVIVPPEGAMLHEVLGDVFPTLKSWRQPSQLLAPTWIDWKAVYPLAADQGNLTAAIQPARHLITGKQALRFEISVNSGSLGGRHLRFDQWVIGAHEAVLRTFEGLTSEDMRLNVWQRENSES